MAYKANTRVSSLDFILDAIRNYWKILKQETEMI